MQDLSGPSAAADGPRRPALRQVLQTVDRGLIVGALSVIGAVALSLTLDRFATLGNAFALLRSISVVGILALGMMIAVVGGNIDLSQVAVALISTGIVVKTLALGLPLPAALACGTCAALALGTVNAVATTFGSVPPLFATLASGMLFIGAARLTIMPGASIYLPDGNAVLAGLGGTIGGVPVPPVVLGICATATHLLLEGTVPGHFIRALGINPKTAAAIGLPVRSLTWLQYLLSAFAAFVAGLLMLSSSGLVDLQTANSTLIFDVILVVVLGGASLSGGRGSVLGVMAATIFVGILLNALTIMDVGSQQQSIVKGMALLLVIVLDGSFRRGEAAEKGI